MLVKTKNTENGNLIGLVLALGVFCVYLLTCSRSVGHEDAGELAAVLHTLGVAHPTGYPLFSLLGRVVSILPFEGPVIWKLNLMGAALTAASTFLFFRVFLFLFTDKAAALFSVSSNGAGQGAGKAAAAAGALILAFSRTYWSEAVSLEVYALHLVFLGLALLLFLGAMAERTTERGARLWILFAYVLGLGFANHMMMVLLAPAFLYLYFRVRGRAAFQGILKAVPPFLLGLTPYLYLPLRAGAGALMNWGDTSSPEALWRHVTAAQYRFKMFSSWDVAVEKLAYFFLEFPREFGYVPLLATAAGAWVLWRGGRGLLLFLALMFCGSIVYAVNYAFNDPNFYLNAYVAVAACTAFGARAALSACGRKLGAARLALVAMVLVPLVSNYRIVDRSRDAAVENYARDVLNSVDSGGILFSSEYWLMASPAYYLQNVEGFRADVAILDIGLFGGAWYYDQIALRHPRLVADSRRKIEDYRVELGRYLRGDVDTARHNRILLAMFHSILEKGRAAGLSVYVSASINPAMIQGYERVPSGLVFRLMSPGDDGVVPSRLPVFRPASPHNPMASRIRVSYAESYANLGGYRALRGDTAEAIRLLERAVELEPDFPDARRYLRLLRDP